MRYLVATLFQLVIMSFFARLLYIEQFQEYFIWILAMLFCSVIVFFVVLEEALNRVFNFWWNFKEFRRQKNKE